MNKLKIPTIIGILTLVLGIGVGVFFINQQQIFRLGASPDITPQDVRVTNVDDSSFSVSWITDRETVGFISWGESSQLGKTIRDESTLAQNIHLITIRGLTANKTYFFTINSQGRDFDNGGIPWQIQTGPKLPTSSSSVVVSGNVLSANQNPVANAIVYLTGSGLSPLSAKTSSTGGFVIPLANLKVTNLSSYANIEGQSQVELFIQGGTLGIATAQISPINANPLPQIILGQHHDFRSQEKTSESQSGVQAGFTVPDDLETQDPSLVVTLESIEEGEVIYTETPEFFGQGPAGKSFTVVIKSDQEISSSLVIPQNGSWSFSPNVKLSEGSHTITIQWEDVGGVLHSLTRNFVVKAADDEPSFESTPSATPKPSVSPSPSPTPIATDSSRISLPATDSGLPTPGTLTPTLIFATMGIGLIAISLLLNKKANL